MENNLSYRYKHSYEKDIVVCEDDVLYVWNKVSTREGGGTKKIAINNAKGLLCVKSSNGILCPIEYRNFEEAIAVRSNTELINCRHIEGLFIECKLEPFKGYYYSDFGAFICDGYIDKQGHNIRSYVVKLVKYKNEDRLCIDIKRNHKKYFSYQIIAQEREGSVIDFNKEKVSVDHISSSPYDDNINNLRIISNSEQSKNPNTIKKLKSGHSKKIKRLSYKVIGVVIETGDVITLESDKVDEYFNKHNCIGGILRCIKGEQQYAYGCKWYSYEQYHGKDDLLEGEIFMPYPDNKEDIELINKITNGVANKNLEVSNKGRYRIWNGTLWTYNYPCMDVLNGRNSIKINHISCKFSRLVCAYWHLHDYKDGYVCAHIDNNRLNDTPENLRWSTVEDNIKDMRHDKRFNIPVAQMDSSFKLINIFESRAFAGEYYGINHSGISKQTKKSVPTLYRNTYLRNLDDYIEGLKDGKYPMPDDLSILSGYTDIDELKKCISFKDNVNNDGQYVQLELALKY